MPAFGSAASAAKAVGGVGVVAAVVVILAVLVPVVVSGDGGCGGGGGGGFPEPQLCLNTLLMHDSKTRNSKWPMCTLLPEYHESLDNASKICSVMPPCFCLQYSYFEAI